MVAKKGPSHKQARAKAVVKTAPAPLAKKGIAPMKEVNQTLVEPPKDERSIVEPASVPPVVTSLQPGPRTPEQVASGDPGLLPASLPPIDPVPPPDLVPGDGDDEEVITFAASEPVRINSIAYGPKPPRQPTVKMTMREFMALHPNVRRCLSFMTPDQAERLEVDQTKAALDRHNKAIDAREAFVTKTENEIRLYVQRHEAALGAAKAELEGLYRMRKDAQSKLDSLKPAK